MFNFIFKDIFRKYIDPSQKKHQQNQSKITYFIDFSVEKYYVGVVEFYSLSFTLYRKRVMNYMPKGYKVKPHTNKHELTVFFSTNCHKTKIFISDFFVSYRNRISVDLEFQLISNFN